MKLKINLNRFLPIILFLISTILLILQNQIVYSWDFQSFFLNYKYLFGNGYYFEFLRPPIPAFIFYLLKPFEFLIDIKILYVIFVSSLFFYSTYILSKSLKFNFLLFYSISLSSYVLFYGLINGSELLSISFLEISLALLFSNKNFSGLFLGFSALTRYTGLVYFPILFFEKNIKKIITNLFYFGFLFIPWFLYNYIKTGNYFTSISDQYANNILFRNYIHQPINFLHFLEISSFLTPFLIIGVYICFKKIYLNLKNKSKINKSKIEIIFILLFIYSIISYISIPMKSSRYLFSITLPSIYFIYLGINFIINILKNKFKNINLKKLIMIISLIIFIINIFILNYYYSLKNYPNKDLYLKIKFDLNKKKLDNCQLESNHWVLLNGVGLKSEPVLDKKYFKSKIKKGKKIILINYKNYNLSKKIPIIIKNKRYIILGENNTCLKPKKYKNTYLDNIEIRIGKINKNPCFVIFRNNPFFEKTCNFINLKGFKLDTNRNLGN